MAQSCYGYSLPRGPHHSVQLSLFCQSLSFTSCFELCFKALFLLLSVEYYLGLRIGSSLMMYF